MLKWIQRLLDRRTIRRRQDEQREARLRAKAKLISDHLIDRAESSALHYGWTSIDVSKGFPNISISTVCKLISEEVTASVGQKFKPVFGTEASVLHVGLYLPPSAHTCSATAA